MRPSYLFVAVLVCASPVSAEGPQKAGASRRGVIDGHAVIYRPGGVFVDATVLF
jgi:hypothetical protein